MHKLREAGISFCLLKGESLASLYHDPLYRISSDTDILIAPDAEQCAVRIMNDLGYTVKERFKTSHHVCCYHPLGGVVELHLRLYDELFEDVWFNYKMCNSEPYRDAALYDADIPVPLLGITDGFIFTVLHFIKHFLSRGAGIRQMMDLLLYAMKHRQEIDWNRFDGLMKYLKYDRFMDCVYQIGVRYFELPDLFSKGEPVDDLLMTRILEDMESGGIFGLSQNDMENFFLRYTEARFSVFKDQRGYERYIKEWSRIPLKKVIFPGRAALINKYPFAERNALFLAAAWLMRFWDFIVRRLSGRARIPTYIDSTVPVNPQQTTRMELIKDLNMV